MNLGQKNGMTNYWRLHSTVTLNQGDHTKAQHPTCRYRYTVRCSQWRVFIRTQSALAGHISSLSVVGCRQQTRCSGVCNRPGLTLRYPAASPVASQYHQTLTTKHH